MAFESEVDGEIIEYDLNLEYDEKEDEYVALYLIGGEVRQVGRGLSVNRAVTKLAKNMNIEIDTMMV